MVGSNTSNPCKGVCAMAEYRLLEPGDPAPQFRQRCTACERFAFDSAAGRYTVLCFFGTAADDLGRRMLQVVDDHRKLFDDDRMAFYGVTIDPEDEREPRVRETLPGVRFLWDSDGTVSRLYGAVPIDAQPGPVSFRRFWMVLDPAQRVRAVFPGDSDGENLAQLVRYLRSLPPINAYAGLQVHAPVLALPGVFEPELCRRLVELHDKSAGAEPNALAEAGAAIAGLPSRRRIDVRVGDPELRTLLQQKVNRRVVPEVLKLFQFDITRMERYVISCYDSRSGGHYSAHRDNGVQSTAHRRFALSINLNEEFDGGQVVFPEYGGKSFKLPTGGALVYSCSLLHEVRPVTRGRRYAFVPFVYDEAAAQLRERNLQSLARPPSEKQREHA